MDDHTIFMRVKVWLRPETGCGLKVEEMMLRLIVSLFVAWHGLVHLLYFAQSRRLFELRAGMVWPDGSWAFTKLLGAEATQSLAGLLCILAGAAFVAGGLGALLGQNWWRVPIVVGAVCSAVTFGLFWDGKLQSLTGSGLIGVLIDLALLTALLILRWPILPI
jgi:hypothetical protein